MSKEKVDAAINEMFAEEAKAPEKKSGCMGEMSQGEYSKDEIAEARTQ